MKYTIERVNPSGVAKVISAAAAMLFVLFFLILVVTTAVQSAESGESTLPLNFSNISIMMIVMPFFYMVGVYIRSYVGALAFNVATRLVGGIQVELTD